MLSKFQKIIDEIIPVFSNIPSSVLKNESFIFASISDNGISGTWSPIFDGATLGRMMYTFTSETNGLCGGIEPLEVLINIEECNDLNEFFTPNFFTPNNDGQNDFWNITKINEGKLIIVSLEIFDRFGKIISKVDHNGKVGTVIIMEFLYPLQIIGMSLYLMV